MRFLDDIAPMLAISLEDDAFGTVPAIERLLGYFPDSPRIHVRLAPQAIGATEIGHFAFFHSRFEHTLWPLAVAWLQSGRLSGSVTWRSTSRDEPPRLWAAMPSSGGMARRDE